MREAGILKLGPRTSKGHNAMEIVKLPLCFGHMNNLDDPPRINIYCEFGDIFCEFGDIYRLLASLDNNTSRRRHPIAYLRFSSNYEHLWSQ